MAEFRDRYGPWAVLAGASEGVGASAARLLAERGVRTVLVSRRIDALKDVAATVPIETRAVALDLSEDGADAALFDATADLEVGLFAYIAGADPHSSRFLDRPVETWLAMVRRNCTTVLGAVHRYATPMVERGHGGIIVVTSGAGWAGGANLVTYGASKAFDLVLGEGLWAELRPRGVDVLSMVLGPTDTPAFRRVLAGRDFEGIADPDDVARDMLDHLADGPTYPPDPSPFGSLPRRQAVELLSQGAAFLEG